MFRKMLIVNRGEIAVRILRTCREMGIPTLTLYTPSDKNSLHVRLADECVALDSPADFLNQRLILQIAQEKGADSLHPGYGFLAERADFVRLCDQAGVRFIGPSAKAMRAVHYKTHALEMARQSGFPVMEFTPRTFGPGDLVFLQKEAEKLGFPVVVKSYRGGRGRGARLVWSPDRLERAVRLAQAESQAVYGERLVYLEKAVLPAHQVGVQILGDGQGNLIHLGEREGSLMFVNQKIIEETPAPCLLPDQRERLWQTALDIAALFNYQNVGTVEFLVDEAGEFYFTEIKPRIQIEHPLTEMVARVDLVREQIRLAAGQPLGITQEDVRLDGCAIQSRVSASDPLQKFLPSPGHMAHMRLPGGPNVRIDTYLYAGGDVPADYDALIAKLVVWGRDRQTCIERLKAALQEFQVSGPATNLPLIQRILEQPAFLNGEYTTEFMLNLFGDETDGEQYYQDLAVIAAILHLRRSQVVIAPKPEKFLRGWHRSSRRLPE